MTAVYIPTPMREFTDGQATLQFPSKTVGELFQALEARHPGIRTRLYDQNGRLNTYIAVFVNEEDIRELEGEATPLRDRDEVYIIPAIAGG